MDTGAKGLNCNYCRFSLSVGELRDLEYVYKDLIG